MTCNEPACIDGIDTCTFDVCRECDGRSETEPVTAALWTIAVAMVGGLALRVVELVRAFRDDADDDDDEPVRDVAPVVYSPLGCGIATTFAGFTEACARRRGHNGRCMCDSEIEHMAEYGAPIAVQSVVEPVIDRAGLQADIAELSRHVEACPVSLLDADHTETEVGWVTGVRLRVEALVSGETFSDETRS